MEQHTKINDSELRKQIKRKAISLGGNSKLRIYGSLHCSTGKRMKTENRVFFKSEQEAIMQGYRPCGSCMREEYKQWKNAFV